MWEEHTLLNEDFVREYAAVWVDKYDIIWFFGGDNGAAGNFRNHCIVFLNILILSKDCIPILHHSMGGHGV